MIELAGVTKIYEPASGLLRMALRSPIKQPLTALDDVSFTVERGAVCALVGPNGAGKSTVFRLLMGLVSPTHGTVRVDGLDPMDPDPALRRIVGYSPADDRSLWLRHTSRENLAFFGRLHGLRTRDLDRAIDSVLEVVDLTRARDQAVASLSNGMRSRLQLARALLHGPSVLLLDEPTGPLDPVGAWELLEVIRSLAAERTITVLISSHRLEAIETLQGNLLVLDRGRLAFRGDLRSLIDRTGSTTLELTFADEAMAMDAAAHLASGHGVAWVSHAGHTAVVGTTLPTGELLSRLNGHLVELQAVRTAGPRLADVLAGLMQGDRR